jgi:23S rRNA pseudouridine2605 synthase
VEAELRRRIRSEITQARGEAEDGTLDDATLAAIIARAVASALTWHLEAPEHTRNATLSSRTWRPSGGPRGGRPQQAEEREFDERGPRQFDERRPRQFDDRRPRQFDQRGPRPFDERGPRPFGDRPRGPREYENRDRDFDERRGPPGRPQFGPRGGGRGASSRGGGFGPRRPRPR